MERARCERCRRLTHRRFMAVDGSEQMVCGSCFCYKVRYRNRAQAQRAADRIAEQNTGRPSWPYACPRCNRFHLTTQEQQNTPRRAVPA